MARVLSGPMGRDYIADWMRTRIGFQVEHELPDIVGAFREASHLWIL
jgi:hypothetical protein